MTRIWLKNDDQPEDGKQYALTGKAGDKCIMNGNTWAQSEVNLCARCGRECTPANLCEECFAKENF